MTQPFNPNEGRTWFNFVEKFGMPVSGIPAKNMQALLQAEGAMKQPNSTSTYGQELRSKQMELNRLQRGWNKLLWQWEHGYYSGDANTMAEFYKRADAYKQAMVAHGEDPDLIIPPSINAGGYAQGFQKSLASKRDDLDWEGGWLKQIEDNVAQNPDWLNSNDAQMYFDKLSEYTILKWAQSKGAIADAEKVRAQVEAMPAKDRQVFNGFMMNFFKANSIDSIKALSNKGYTHASAFIDELGKLSQDAMGSPGNMFQYDENGNITGKGAGGARIEAAMKAATLLYKDLKQNGEEIPIELAAAVEAHKNGLEAFTEYVMRNANVDRRMVWNSACDQMAINRDNYNRMLPKLGLFQGWQYDGYMPSKDFGLKLEAWQNAQPVDTVMQNAGLGVGGTPKAKPPKKTQGVTGVSGVTEPEQQTKRTKRSIETVNGKRRIKI